MVPDPEHTADCAACGAEVHDADELCPQCGRALGDPSDGPAGLERRTARRYPALRVIVGLYQLAAALVAVAAIFVVFGEGVPPMGRLIAVAGGGIVVLTVVATAESIKVIVDIEENTRHAADRLDDLEPLATARTRR